MTEEQLMEMLRSQVGRVIDRASKMVSTQILLALKYYLLSNLSLPKYCRLSSVDDNPILLTPKYCQYQIIVRFQIILTPKLLKYPIVVTTQIYLVLKYC